MKSPVFLTFQFTQLMRTPHFLLAALVALATSFSLRAFAWHRHTGPGGWRHGPMSRYGGPCGPSRGWGFGPAGAGPPVGIPAAASPPPAPAATVPR